MAEGGPPRLALLGEEELVLLGREPLPGETLRAVFEVPAARRAQGPLRAEDLGRGLVFLSTLPNIQKHACLAQIVDLEVRVRPVLPDARIVHVSADEALHWHEVDHFHPGVEAEGYTLSTASEADRAAFVDAFGVAVAGRHRIAHGLFALWEGAFLRCDIPVNQMATAAVKEFVNAARIALSRARAGQAP